MNQQRIPFRAMLGHALLGLTAFGLPVHSALADSRELPASNEKWKAECGSCHVAYPPRFLPASAWRRIMASLDRHFGTDANPDPKSAAEIGAFLETNAGRESHGDADNASTRITESAWFKRQHGELVPSAWTNKLVKTPVNCGACHASADRGNFKEHFNWFRRKNSRYFDDAVKSNNVYWD